MSHTLSQINIAKNHYLDLRFKSVMIMFINFQARGLDVLPTTISRFRKGGDEKTAELLEGVVYPEEITHCAAGVKWFKYLCLRSKDEGMGSEKSDSIEDEEVIPKFHETVRGFFRGPLKPPFNEAARKAAGFGPQWYEPLAVKHFSAE